MGSERSPPNPSERCSESTSWGSLVRAQYRPFSPGEVWLRLRLSRDDFAGIRSFASDHEPRACHVGRGGDCCIARPDTGCTDLRGPDHLPGAASGGGEEASHPRRVEGDRHARPVSRPLTFGCLFPGCTPFGTFGLPGPDLWLLWPRPRRNTNAELGTNGRLGGRATRLCSAAERRPNQA
jgi:hypothetical protein